MCLFDNFIVCCFSVNDVSCELLVLTLTADSTWFIPGCISGLCGAIGADNCDDVYSKPQCHRKSCPRFVVVIDVDNALHIP